MDLSLQVDFMLQLVSLVPVEAALACHAHLLSKPQLCCQQVQSAQFIRQPVLVQHLP